MSGRNEWIREAFGERDFEKLDDGWIRGRKQVEVGDN